MGKVEKRKMEEKFNIMEKENICNRNIIYWYMHKLVFISFSNFYKNKKNLFYILINIKVLCFY